MVFRLCHCLCCQLHALAAGEDQVQIPELSRSHEFPYFTENIHCRAISAMGFAWTVTFFSDMLWSGRSFGPTGTFSIASSTSNPDITLHINLSAQDFPRNKWREPHFPKIGYFMFRCGSFWYAKKNCDPLVSGPLFAIPTIPRAVNFKESWISSAKNFPYILSPPFPVPAHQLRYEAHIIPKTKNSQPVGSPPWTMKPETNKKE
jgi:hypothetical protein